MITSGEKVAATDPRVDAIGGQFTSPRPRQRLPLRQPANRCSALPPKRDGYECQIRDIGCTNEATEVDDIIPVAIAGITRAQATDDTLQAACNNCHHRKTERERLKGLAVSNARRAARKRLPKQKHPEDY